MTIQRILPLTLIAAAVLAGCSSMPANNSLLDEARADYGNAQASSKVTSYAAGELRQAGHTLDRANAAWTKDEDTHVVNHLAYVTKQEVAIARETADQKAAEQSLATAAAERNAVRLDARTREAERAQRSAQYSQRQAEESRRSAEESRRESDASQRSAELSRRESDVARMNAENARRQAGAERQAASDALANAEAARMQANAAIANAQDARQQTNAALANAQDARQQTNLALANAQDARQRTEEAQRRSRQLEAQLVALEAKKTDRGMVVTLGDVLFDTDEAQLKAGGVRNVQRLADFFRENPERNVMIEGFTDSTGDGDHNQRLSDRRADSVRSALLAMGMTSDRITWRGYGESYPVAGNDTAAGRQLNRRVELVVSDDNGKVAPR